MHHITFRTCDPIQDSNDIINFYASLSGNFEGTVQYNKDNKAFEVSYTSVSF